MKLQEFLDRLNLEVTLSPVESHQIEHVAEMTQHTSEFNLNGIVRSSREISDLLSGAPAECWGVQVCDRFGDYGLAGVLIWSIEHDTLAVETLLLNCRVLGKGVEYETLRQLARLARERNAATISLRYRRTRRNAAAAEFLKKVAASGFRDSASFTITLPVEVAASLTPPETLGASPAHTDAPQSSVTDFITTRLNALGAQGRAELFTRIADELATGAQIQQAIRQQKQRTRPDLEKPFLPPRTPTEERIASIWREGLGIQQIGIHDNLLELGGHSLLATQIISRLQEAFQVDLGLRALFDAPTVESLAAFIEQRQLETKAIRFFQ